MIAVVIIAAFFIFLVTLGIHAQFRRRVTGREGLVGEIGIARADINDVEGTVFVRGELWNAISETPIKKGSRIKIIAVKNMVVKVNLLNSD